MKTLLAVLLLAAAAILAILLTPEEASALDLNGCLSADCHSNPLLTKPLEGGGAIPLYVDEQATNVSAHRFIDCTKCHTTDPHSGDSPLTKQSLAAKCGTCHEHQYDLHLESIHGQQLTQGNPDVATCVDCHSAERNPHSIIRVLEHSAPAYKKNIADTCGVCHGDKELMANYGIVEKIYESYMRSFHGKAMQLGTYELSQLDKATCTNCHGTHSVQAVTDPLSPVAGMDSLAQTCEQCHPGAGARFASGFLGHREASPQSSAHVYYAEKFFKVLTTTVIAFGAIVTVSAAAKWTRSRGRD